MKRTLLFLSLILTTVAYSQIGIKAGLTYNADDGLFKSAETAYTNNGKGNAGYHVGLYKKFGLTGVFIQPELWYVNYKNEFEDQSGNNFDLNYKRIDVPVSIGTNVLGIGQIQAGPVFSYYFEDDIDIANITEVDQDDISLALQIGAGISLQQLDISIRYDFPLGDRETKWVRENGYNFITESSPKILHVSLGYNF
ncbi:outer membrane beta-barrel protein [Flavobacteriaceae bacterium Ap0902]|nr:outer membrane beta-barrel protein [Flavobacteriaceae bacterium Ap0902]